MAHRLCSFMLFPAAVPQMLAVLVLDPVGDSPLQGLSLSRTPIPGTTMELELPAYYLAFPVPASYRSAMMFMKPIATSDCTCKMISKSGGTLHLTWDCVGTLRLRQGSAFTS